MSQAAPSTDPVIDIRDLSYRFDREPTLVDVSLQVQPGDFLAIVGPNGGGKTTLLRQILGLLKPDRGSIRIFGKPPGQSASRIGYVPQHGNLPPGFPATVEEVVLMGLAHGHRHGPLFRRDERERAREAMRRAGVDDLARLRMEELSGGQRQRVLIARALITEPELLLLDEPLSNIDPYGRQCILETLTGLGRGTTIVMVSHDLGITANAVTAIAAVNRYLLINRGQTLTEEMIELMYGRHEEGCPVHDLVHHLSDALTALSPHTHQPHILTHGESARPVIDLRSQSETQTSSTPGPHAP